jgi:hypothetical protein
MRYIHCCECGEKTETTAESQILGRCFQCPACKMVWAHVYPKDGGRAWIRVDPRDVEFYHLIKSRDSESAT